jgi:NADPH-dependent 2,4-dienoyl-CoA reductase/sulfur reductase-like enzyme/nitrite reductase/ring-hydroxylating ferredoxin subunit
MQQFSVKGRDILLARLDDQFFAIAPYCSHYGAPLSEGVMHGDRVVCPWHNACFSLTSGTQLEPPGQDNLTHYPVHIEGNSVYVEISLSEVAPVANTFVELPKPITEHIPPDFVQPDLQSDDRTFIIVGAGAAGSAASEMLRREGFRGRILVLTADSELPYDRTALSKAYLQNGSVADPDLLRSAEFYEQLGIEIKTSTRVSHLDIKTKQLICQGDITLPYDMLLLATGGSVRQLPMDGADQPNVFTLRRAEDAKQILQAAQAAKRAVVVGAGFIGMEVAASLKQQGLDVTVVASSAVPFEKILGRDVGHLFRQIHEAEGVQFKLNAKATALKGNGKVESVELDTGEVLPADFVVVGIGVEPATDFAGTLTLDKDDRSIIVDEYLQAAPNVYAAGDIAQFPYFRTGEPTRIEHWRVAMQQGRVAACNMLGKTIPFRAVPFFWTGQFGQKLRYVGHAEDWDNIMIHGSLEDKSFLAFYVKDDEVLAVAGIGRDRDIAAISELMRIQTMPKADELKQTDMDWVHRLRAF